MTSLFQDWVHFNGRKLRSQPPKHEAQPRRRIASTKGKHFPTTSISCNYYDRWYVASGNYEEVGFLDAVKYR